MSRKHNVQKNRSASHYPDRLRARGETAASVRMPFYGAPRPAKDNAGRLIVGNGKRYETAQEWLNAVQRKPEVAS